MIQLLKLTRPAYRLLLCAALLFMGTIQGTVLKWDWVKKDIAYDKEFITYLTEENKTQHEAFRKLMAAATIVEDEFAKTTPDDNKITQAFTDMKGYAAGYFFSADAVNVIWEKIKDCEEIPTATNSKVSFAHLAQQFKTNDRSTASAFASTAKNKQITTAMNACLKKYRPTYSTEKDYFDKFFDEQNKKDPNFKDIATAKKTLTDQIDSFGKFAQTQAAIETLLKLLTSATPDPIAIHAAMLNVTSSLKISLAAMNEFYKKLDPNSKTIFSQDITETIDSYKKEQLELTIKDAIEHIIKIHFYTTIKEILTATDLTKTIARLTDPASFYVMSTKTLAPESFVTFINKNVLDTLTALNDFKLVNGAENIKQLDKPVAAIADIISLFAGTDTKAIEAYKNGIDEAIVRISPTSDANTLVKKIYSDRLDGKKNTELFSKAITKLLEDSAITANNAAFKAITSFVNANNKKKYQEAKDLLATIPSLTQKAIKQNLLWIQLISANESKKAVERIKAIETKDTHAITKAFIEAIATARDSKQSTTPNLDQMVEDIYNTHMAPTIKKLEETFVITPPITTNPTEPVKPAEQPIPAETETKMLPAIEKFANALKIITTA